MKNPLKDLDHLYRNARQRWEETNRAEAKARHGCGAAGTAMSLAYTIAVGAFVIDGNREEFVVWTNRILQSFHRLYERHDAGENLYLVRNGSFHHVYIFHALSINDLQTARLFAERCDPEKLVPDDAPHPFNQELTLSLRSVILGDGDKARHWLDKFDRRCQAKRNAAYAGYGLALRAIMEADERKFQQALVRIVEDFPRQTRAQEFFYNADKAAFSCYGVGLVHLARSRGLVVEFDHPLIPAALAGLPEHTYQPPVSGSGFLQSIRRKAGRLFS